MSDMKEKTFFIKTGLIGPEFDILISPLENVTEKSSYLLSWAHGFLNNNSQLNESNRLEYSTLLQDLEFLNRACIHMTNANPDYFLKGDRRNIGEKIAYAEKVGERTRKYITRLRSYQQD